MGGQQSSSSSSSSRSSSDSEQPIRCQGLKGTDEQLAAFAQGKNDFTILVNGSTYQTNATNAAILSDYAMRSMISDACLNKQIVLELPEAGNMEAVTNFLSSLTVEIDNDDKALELYWLASYLLIDSLAAKVQLSESAVLKGGLPFLKKIFDYGGNCTPILDVLAAKFDDLDVNELSKLPIALIDMLLRSANLSTTPEKLMGFLNMIFDWRQAPNHRLAKFLPIAAMSDAELEEFLYHPKLNLNRMKYALMRADTVTAVPMRKTKGSLIVGTFDFVPGAVWTDGVFRKAGFVPECNPSSVAVGPGDYDAMNLFSKEKEDDYFCTDSDEGPSITIGLAPYELVITGYAMESWKYGLNGVVPVSWKLMGLSRDNGWMELDGQEDQNTLIGNKAKGHWEVQPELVQAIRLEQLKTGNPGNRRLALGAFEVYGELRKVDTDVPTGQ